MKNPDIAQKISARLLPKPLLFLMCCSWLISSSLLADAKGFPDEAYVQVHPEGYLHLNGERVRYWGWIGHFWLTGPLKEYKPAPGDSPEELARKSVKAQRVWDALAQRIHDTGFNLVRLWDNFDPTREFSAGDGSNEDRVAFTLYALEKRGIKLWCTFFNNLGNVSPEDVSIIDDPETAEAWKAAVAELPRDGRLRSNLTRVFDPRINALTLQRMEEFANFRNPYKDGLRLADDPQVALWELANEDWWLNSMLKGRFQKLPPFFQQQIFDAWGEFLLRKYGSKEELESAWGFLLPGEDPAKGTVILAPLASATPAAAVSDANPEAVALLTEGGAKEGYELADFTRQRGADVIEFLIEAELKFKLDQKAVVRTWGKGLALSPIVLDTGDGFRIQSLELHSHGDGVPMCTYMWGTAQDVQQPRFPWVSLLEEYPRTAMGIPWAEVGRIPGKPFYIYETQINNPAKYRAEFPYIMASLGAIQDMDIICWHLFGRPNDPGSARTVFPDDELLDCKRCHRRGTL